MNQEQQLGVMLERLQDACAGLERLESRFNDLETRVNDKFKTAEVVLSTFKFLGLTIVAIVTFKFGDVTKLWHAFFG